MSTIGMRNFLSGLIWFCGAITNSTFRGVIGSPLTKLLSTFDVV